MVSGNKHLIVGAVSTAIFLAIMQTPYLLAQFPMFNYLTFTPLNWIIILAIVYLCSQLPDIDTNMSYVNNVFNTGLAAIIIYAFIKNLPYMGILAAIAFAILQWIHHRTITHTILFGLIVSAMLYFLSVVYAVIALICFLSHLIADGELFDDY